VPPPERRPGRSGAAGQPGRSNPAGRDRPAPDRGRDRREGAGRPPTDRGATRQRPAGPHDDRRPRPAEPPLPEDLPPAELDRDARAELRSLPTSLAERVTSHLLAAGLLLDDDPAAAHAHAWYARSLAPRLAIVREAAGITAYRTGEFAAAIAELRAVRRMTGDPSHLPILADAERGLGRPERALAFAKDPDVAKLDPAARVELAIVVSGARRDRGENEAAVVGLQGHALDSDRLQPWTARLWYAYAEALLAADRVDEARRWFDSVAAVDDDAETDAADRAASLPPD
jgi:tetratricopeptide (TPR) repeat protein